jgi:plasmid stabilization system protein ParE
MKLAYSKDAIRDLQRLRACIGENNPAAAARIAQELIRRIEGLRVFPESGQPVPAAPAPESIRDMIFGSYTVRYVPRKDVVIILRIWHQREDR